jgi:hypothetical protein
MANNFHVNRNFIIQPNALVSYNIFGEQNWNSAYGDIAMNTGMLNGINVAPGLNLIYGRENWSAYFTGLYMYNINDNISGTAGPVHLPSIAMRHGWAEYGFGGTKTWKNRLMGWTQITARNGGRNGIALQAGLSWRL